MTDNKIETLRKLFLPLELPWDVEEIEEDQGNYPGDHYTIQSGDSVVIMKDQNMCDLDNIIDTKSCFVVNDKSANIIVTAVNEFPKLLEEVKALRQALRDIQYIYNIQTDDAYFNPKYDRIMCIINNILKEE